MLVVVNDRNGDLTYKEQWTVTAIPTLILAADFVSKYRNV